MNNRIYQLAWAHYRETQCHEKNPVEDEMFRAYVMAQPKPQTYRYLRAVLAEIEASTYSAIEDHIRQCLKDLSRGWAKDPLVLSTETIAVGNQLRDMATAFEAFKKELEHEPTASSEAVQPSGSGEVPEREPQVVRRQRKASRSKRAVGEEAGVSEGGSR